jgi:hypothetical protein
MKFPTIFLTWGVLVETAHAAAAATGAIVSAQFYCTKNPCEENWQLGLARTDMNAASNTPNDVFLQVYLPPANTAERKFEVFTAFDENSRVFVTVAADYPQAQSMTVWASTVSAEIDVAYPVVAGAVVAYPVSSSPYPLNVMPLKISRLICGPDGVSYVTFTNGEVHRIDPSTGAFTLVASIVPDALQLGTTHPYATWGQVYDAASNSLFSVVFGANEAYLATTSLATFTTAPYLPLINPGTGPMKLFAPDTFINAHMLDLPDGSRRLMLCTESLDNVGFDQMNFVNMTSGQLEGPVENLMSDANIILSCDEAVYQCDKWRVSTWDASTSTLWFQGHFQDPNEGPVVKMFGLTFELIRETGRLGYYINSAPAYISYGYTGYQFVTYPAPTGAVAAVATA